MPSMIYDILELLGYLLRALGFLLFGYGAVRFILDAYHKSVWQVQAALMLGLFGLLIALTDFASPGSAGAFALGAGAAYFMAGESKKNEPEEKKESQNHERL
jgi:hypothetical protein